VIFSSFLHLIKRLNHLPPLCNLPLSDKMAAIPSSGSLIAATDYYRRRVGSTSSNTSCGSAEYSGEVIPHPPGLARQDSGHWWSSFFFPKGMNGSDSQKNTQSAYTVGNGQVTCIAREMARRMSESSEGRDMARRMSESSDTSGRFEPTTVLPSTPPPSSSS